MLVVSMEQHTAELCCLAAVGTLSAACVAALLASLCWVGKTAVAAALPRSSASVEVVVLLLVAAAFGVCSTVVAGLHH